MRLKLSNKDDPRLISANVSQNAVFRIAGEQSASIAQLLQDNQLAAFLLSKVCMQVFQGKADLRTDARSLDYIAYGSQLLERGGRVVKLFADLVGDRESADVTDKGSTKF